MQIRVWVQLYIKVKFKIETLNKIDNLTKS